MSCQDATPVEVRVAPANSATTTPVASAAPARRPRLRHILERTEERCEVYSMDGDTVSPAERTPCPQDLDIGERIRVAGKTCFRESQNGTRTPVVCPGPLLLRELRDAGPDGAKL
jgi:hypothetical protein